MKNYLIDPKLLLIICCWSCSRIMINLPVAEGYDEEWFLLKHESTSLSHQHLELQKYSRYTPFRTMSSSRLINRNEKKPTHTFDVLNVLSKIVISEEFHSKLQTPCFSGLHNYWNNRHCTYCWIDADMVTQTRHLMGPNGSCFSAEPDLRS